MGSHAFSRHGEPVAGKLCLVDALLPTEPGLAAANGHLLMFIRPYL